MKIVCSAILILGLVLLVDKTVAYPPEIVQIQENGTIIAHPEPSETLTRSELLEELGKLPGEYAGKVSERVAHLLYSAKNKADNEVMAGVTVAELVAQNQFETLALECTKDAIRRRTKIYAKTRPLEMGNTGVEFAINVYTLRLLRLVAGYCGQNFIQVVNENINDSDWMSFLVAYHDQDCPTTNDSQVASSETTAEVDVSSLFYSRIATFVEDDAKREAKQAARMKLRNL